VLLRHARTSVAPRRHAAEAQEILVRADTLFRAARSQDLRDSIAEKLEGLQRYDLPAMQAVLAVVMWGRSGSLLLASYLDGHDDVIMLPETRGQRLHEFFRDYPSLSWRDKLLGYPAFLPEYPRFFEGDFSISSADYYAAVQACRMLW